MIKRWLIKWSVTACAFILLFFATIVATRWISWVSTSQKSVAELAQENDARIDANEDAVAAHEAEIKGLKNEVTTNHEPRIEQLEKVESTPLPTPPMPTPRVHHRRPKPTPRPWWSRLWNPRDD